MKPSKKSSLIGKEYLGFNFDCRLTFLHDAGVRCKCGLLRPKQSREDTALNLSFC
jgi:hypothetical protein